MSEPCDDDPVRGRPAALDDVVRASRGGDGRSAVGGVFGRWDEAVGPAWPPTCRPVRLDGGALLVEVDDPAWATQVRLPRRRRHAGACATSPASTVERLEVRVRAPGAPPADDAPSVD